MATKLVGGLAAVALIAPAGASAATKVYGGTTDGGGTIALDVKVSKRGIPKKITEIRGKELPASCEKSDSSTVSARVPVEIKVKRNLKFSFSFADPTYGNTSSINGKFRGRKLKKVSGVLQYENHFPADPYAPEPLPEENCSTGELGYMAKKGGADVVFPASRLRR